MKTFIPSLPGMEINVAGMEMPALVMKEVAEPLNQLPSIVQSKKRGEN